MVEGFCLWVSSVATFVPVHLGIQEDFFLACEWETDDPLLGDNK